MHCVFYPWITLCVFVSFCAGASNLARKVDQMFNVQQQMLQELGNISNCVRSIAASMGLEPNMNVTPRPVPSIPAPPTTMLPPHSPNPEILHPEPILSTSAPPTIMLPPSTPSTGIHPPATSTPRPPSSVLQPSTSTPDPHKSRSTSHEPGALPGSLLQPAEVLAKYPRLRRDCRMGELATKLARESYFGKELMRRSTGTACWSGTCIEGDNHVCVPRLPLQPSRIWRCLEEVYRCY